MSSNEAVANLLSQVPQNDKAAAIKAGTIQQGPFTTEWLSTQLEEHDAIVGTFEKRGVQYFIVPCPNANEHTVESTPSETVCYIYNGYPVFKCQHQHCADWNFERYAAVRGIQYNKERRGKVVTPSRVSLTRVSDIGARSVQYLINDCLVQFAINTLGASGGTGKTAIVCAMIASITTGKPFWSELAKPLRRDTLAKPGSVLFLSAEDSFVYVLRNRLEKAGADVTRVYTVDIADPSFKSLKFGSDPLRHIIEELRPDLIVFDPWQAFTPPNIRLGDRNAVRQCLEPLIGYGEKFGTTTLLVAHSNKMAGMFGRNRLADSADLWDASRLVLLAGKTQDGDVRYLSMEKNNYGVLADTWLFTIDEGNAVFKGSSPLKDEDYVRAATPAKASPKLDDAVDFIKESLKNSERILVGDLQRQAHAAGIGADCFRRAKEKLRDQGLIRYEKESGGKNKGVKWFVAANNAGPCSCAPD